MSKSDLEARIQEMASAYRKSWALFAAIEIGLFDELGPDFATPEELAARLHAGGRRLRILLDLLAHYGLVARRDGRYAAVEDLLPLIDPARNDNIQARLAHSVRTARSWIHAGRVVRHDLPARELPPEEEGPDANTRAFHLSLGLRGYEVMQELSPLLALKKGARILDIGGGFGDLCRPFLEADPESRAVIYEAPDTARLAKTHLDELGFGERVETVGGDFMHDDLPGGFDLIIVSSILHIYSPEENRELLTRLHKAAADNGKLLVREIMLYEDRSGPEEGVQFSMHMALNTHTGEAYPPEDVIAWLDAAGFCDARRLELGHERYYAVVGEKKAAKPLPASGAVA